MGDRVSVVLTVPSSELERAFKIVGDAMSKPENGSFEDGDLTELYYGEVNWGELDFEQVLINNNIPFSTSWRPGYEFGAGGRHFRVLADGETAFKEIYESDSAIEIDDLKKVAEKGMDAVNALIAEKEAEIEVMPWDEQLAILKQRADS